MQHYQALLRIDTRNPPGNETVLAEYVKRVLEKEGIPAKNRRLRSESGRTWWRG